MPYDEQKPGERLWHVREWTAYGQWDAHIEQHWYLYAMSRYDAKRQYERKHKKYSHSTVTAVVEDT